MSNNSGSLDAVDRLRRSRSEMVALAHELRGDRVDGSGPDHAFPRSRIMRALTGNGGRLALGSAAVAMMASRPRLAWRVLRFAPVLLRPLAMRYVLPLLMRAMESKRSKPSP